MEKTVREISKETFDKNDILNLKMESNKMEEIYRSSFNEWIGAFIFFGIIALIAISTYIYAINENKEWVAEYGYKLWDFPTFYLIAFFGCTAALGWSIYHYIQKRNEATNEFIEVNKELSKVNDYDSYIDFKEWLVNDKSELLTKVSKAVRKSKKSNDLAKGLIIGSMLF